MGRRVTVGVLNSEGTGGYDTDYRYVRRVYLGKTRYSRLGVVQDADARAGFNLAVINHWLLGLDADSISLIHTS